MRIKLLILIAFICFPWVLSAKALELTPDDIHTQVNELLFHHMSERKLTPEIIERSLTNFVEQLDPLKVYFTLEEVDMLTQVSQEGLEDILKSFYKSDFSHYEKIYYQMIECIERRSALEKASCTSDAQEEESSLDNNVWAESVEQLKEKLHSIRKMQTKISEKFEEMDQERFFTLLEKRRTWRELEIIGEKKQEQASIIYGYILKSIAHSLDSQTDYFTPKEAQNMMMLVQQRLLGVGIRLIDDLSGFKIIEILEGGPANKQGGLYVNDRIIAVDNEPVLEMDIQKAVQLIQGAEDSEVKLTVLRHSEAKNGDEPVDVTIIRGSVVIEETRLQAFTEPYADGCIGHIVLHGFYQDPSSSSSEDLLNKISEIQNEHALKGIILDLRNNGGGLLLQGVAVSSFFLDHGIVATTKQHNRPPVHFRSDQPEKLWDGPLIVLINKASASAAEIVAQSLQDYGRAIIVGDRESFGKGTYQITSIVPEKNSINPKGEFKVTQGIYYTVSGKTPQLVGVQADIEVPGFLSKEEYGEQFSKYPIPNNSIDASYDDLPWKYALFKEKYAHKIQYKMNHFSKHLPILKANSTKRIQEHSDYQSFLKGLKKEDGDPFKTQTDFQLSEAFNIMKDFIYLCEQDQDSLRNKK